MATLWTHRVLLFVRAVDNTAANRIAFGDIFANNDSGELSADEQRLFDAPIRLSTSGAAPAQVLGIETPVKAAMRDALRAFLDTLSDAYYLVVRNWDNGVGGFTGLLVIDNGASLPGLDTLVGVAPWDTTPFAMQNALAYLEDQRGLLVIPDAEA